MPKYNTRFIFITNTPGRAKGGQHEDQENKTKIRSQAMKHYRRHQRVANMTKLSDKLATCSSGSHLPALGGLTSQLLVSGTSIEPVQGKCGRGESAKEQHPEAIATSGNGPANLAGRPASNKLPVSKLIHHTSTSSLQPLSRRRFGSSGMSIARSSFVSPEAWRQHLLQLFYDTHFTPSMLQIGEVLFKVHDWFRLHPSREMRAATDCILLHGLSVKSQERDHLLAARSKNDVAVASLRTTMERGDCSLDVYYAIDALATCEALVELSNGPDVWRRHARGLSAVFQLHGPAAFKSSIGQYVIDLTVIIVIDALLSRKGLSFVNAEWLEAMSRHCHSRVHTLFQIASCIPALLEATENSIQCSVSKSLAESLSRKLHLVEEALKGWLRDWYGSLAKKWSPYVSVPSSTLDPLRSGDNSFPPPLEVVYEFPSLVEAIMHNLYWTIMLTVLGAKADLVRHCAVINAGTERVASSTLECASNICRTAPYLVRELCEVATGLSTLVSPLRLASQRLSEFGNEPLSKWCSSMSDDMVPGATGEHPMWVTRACLCWLTSAI